MGLTSGVNEFIADYVEENPQRLISCGGLHPRHTHSIEADIELFLRLKIRMTKIHPPHQLLFPNDYMNGVKELELIYRAAEAHEIPVMFHTGTSILPARAIATETLFLLTMSPSIFPSSRLFWRTAAGPCG
jgi:predicted TIM-barrel fold metal-dependent hydrolase